MNKRRHWAATPALFVGIAVVGVAWTLSYGGLFGSSRESLPEESRGSVPPPGAIAVTVAPLTLRPIHRMVNCVGTLHAFEQVTVSAKVEGRVRKIAHDVGDRVKPGDLLLQIDPVDFNLSVRQAQSALDVELAKLGLATRDRHVRRQQLAERRRGRGQNGTHAGTDGARADRSSSGAQCPATS